ncbi:MAG: formylglycine-generating enzyme family protein [Kiritimatiellae bacterium]|nr:formylglycine-generating enzyme family protein [Kiritimatiellia bacterium]
MRKQLACIAAACALTALADPNDPQIALVGSNQGFDRVVTVRYTLDEPAVVTFDVKTNGVSIGAENLKLAYGDVHRVVEPTGENEVRTLFWPAHEAWPDHRFGENVVSVEVTAWATNSPPDYMVIKLVGDDKGARTFYTAPEQLPGVGGVTNDMYKTDYLVMRRIPAAGKTFRMGSPSTEPGRRANEILHYVSLTNDFYMSVFNLTQGQYSNVIGSSPTVNGYISNYQYSPFHPVNGVFYNTFRGTGKVWPADGHQVATSSPLGQFRNSLNLPTLDLPTEAEWEFACRAGTTSGRYDGLEYDNSGYDRKAYLLAWLAEGRGQSPHAVGLLLPNGFGLYDMYGDVCEFCLDRFAADDSYATAGEWQIAPKGPASGNPVVKGISTWWSSAGNGVRSAYRDELGSMWNMAGYRLVFTF